MVRKMTEANLKIACAGESQVNMRYTIYAKKAGEEGSPRLQKKIRVIPVSKWR